MVLAGDHVPHGPRPVGCFSNTVAGGRPARATPSRHDPGGRGQERYPCYGRPRLLVAVMIGVRASGVWKICRWMGPLTWRRAGL